MCAALAVGTNAWAQGRPLILRGGLGVAVPFGTAAEIWKTGPDGMLAVSLPSWGRTALRFEGAYAQFPVDVDKLRQQHHIPAPDTLALRGGSRSAFTVMALIETYWSSSGGCPGTFLPRRFYTLLGVGYAGIR